MGAITDLWRSERGLLCLAIIIAATVLVSMGTLSVDDWKELIMIVFGTYVAGKTATSVAAIVKTPTRNEDDADRAARARSSLPTRPPVPPTTVRIPPPSITNPKPGDVP